MLSVAMLNVTAQKRTTHAALFIYGFASHVGEYALAQWSESIRPKAIARAGAAGPSQPG